ncbi:mammalian ependymin-related protein 1-like [Pomacea canaliculata]|uniref:mammalian ependymin-related protein 1-like n=1 Tax=Pomacea canaliculata TaxID=400727 RepID=UPI000D72D790|nr:mammalian ependymin-related protein 1-like [Pomacea canaliculata]
MLAAIFLLAFGLVATQEPRPCVSPPQWEGRLFRNDWSKNFTQIAQISYDETNRRVREIEELDFSTGRDYFDVLYLHNINVEYRLNLRTRQCNTTTLSRPFIPFGVPPDARYDVEYTVGPANIPEEHITVIRFDGNITEGAYFGTVTSPDCVPVTSGFFSNRTGFIHSTFYDITTGIPDPSVFVPPRSAHGCKRGSSPITSVL